MSGRDDFRAYVSGVSSSGGGITSEQVEAACEKVIEDKGVAKTSELPLAVPTASALWNQSILGITATNSAGNQLCQANNAAVDTGYALTSANIAAIATAEQILAAIKTKIGNENITAAAIADAVWGYRAGPRLTANPNRTQIDALLQDTGYQSSFGFAGF